MKCPSCNGTRLLVTDSRQPKGQNAERYTYVPDNATYRRRECYDCGHRFSTYEITATYYKTLVLREDATGIESLKHHLTELLQRLEEL